jgi:hypothetical protein
MIKAEVGIEALDKETEAQAASIARVNWTSKFGTYLVV